MELKNNDSFLRISLIPSLSSLRLSTAVWSLSRLSPIKNFKCRFLSRSIGLFVRFYWPMSRRLFSATSISLHRPFLSPSSPSFAIALWFSSGIDPLARTWLTVANLITGLPHLVSALCIFFSLVRAQVYLLASPSYSVFLYLFSSFTAPHREQTHFQCSQFLRTSSAFSFSAKLCGERDCS